MTEGVAQAGLIPADHRGATRDGHRPAYRLLTSRTALKLVGVLAIRVGDLVGRARRTARLLF